MVKITILILYSCWVLISGELKGSADGKSSSLNFLFVIVDDLRPALGCYGDTRAYTPNLDRLAQRSVLFERAYAQQALCAPSRNSLLTSRRPSSLQLYDVYSYWRDKVGNFTTMPQHFKNHGYRTAPFGKIFHPGASSNNNDDSPYSWTEPTFHPYTEIFKNAPVCPTNTKQLASNLICPVRVKSMPNATLPDIETLQAAKTFLRKTMHVEKPFFLAVGFHKPHIPIKYPKRYLKYHPLRKYHLPSDYQWPSNLTHLAYNPWMDLRQRDDVRKLGLDCPWQKIPTRFARKIMQSYYAAVTYIDHLVGQLLHELELRALRDNTIVVLTSDHGWSLGEHSEWAKYSNFEVALQVPLLISVPGLAPTRVREPVELLDVFPTLAELAGFPIPNCQQHPASDLCSEGSSLLPLLRSTELDGSQLVSNWKGTAISLYPRLGVEPVCKPKGDEPRLHRIKIMGYSIRTINYRYTIWLPFSWRNNRPDWTKILAEELYDHNLDTREINNVAIFTDYKLQKQCLKNTLLNSIR